MNNVPEAAIHPAVLADIGTRKDGRSFTCFCRKPPATLAHGVYWELCNYHTGFNNGIRAAEIERSEHPQYDLTAERGCDADRWWVGLRDITRRGPGGDAFGDTLREAFENAQTDLAETIAEQQG